MFIQAVESFKKDYIGNLNKFSNINPIYIQTKTTIIPENYQESFNTRSQSMATVNAKMNASRDEFGLFNQVTSSFKGMFKKD